MKKHAYPLLLCSLALLLGACGDPKPDGGNSISNGGGTPVSSIDNISSSSRGESGSSTVIPSSSIDYTIGWSQEVLDVMEPHCGGHAIPFIDLPGRILATWVEASTTYDYNAHGYVVDEEEHLSILSTGSFDAALAGQAKLTYQKAGWNVDFNRDTYALHAVDSETGIVVDFYGVYDANDKMTNPQIDVFYSEPFLIPDKGAWRTTTLEALASIGVESPHALPYVYLGTLAEEATVLGQNSSEPQVLIEGKAGIWNTRKNDILSAARLAFPRSKKWAETSTSVSDGSSSYSATCFTKSFSDGYIVEAILFGADLEDPYYSSNPPTPYLLVTCSQQQ